MKLYTFTASSPSLALQKAQNACGEEALVISTKQIQKKSLISDGLYEVVVAIDDSKNIKKNKPTKSIKQKNKAEDVLLNLSTAAKQISKIDNFSSSLDTLKPKKRSNSIELDTIQNNLDQLNDKIQILQNMIWHDAQQKNELIIPPEFAQIYKIAKESGMDPNHLKEIMKLSIENMPLYMRNSSKTIKRYFQVLLKKMIPARIESQIPKGVKKVVMFVGPTGVGKTTTLAKIAARYSFLKYKNRVGIITLDTYRIGAVEQLFQYAKMMKLPIEDVTDKLDFKKALNALSYCDLILIDTVGSSQFDKEKISKISTFLKDTNIKIDINLVLSASTKLEDLNDIYKNFSFLQIDTLIITKLDETKKFGNIFSLIYNSQKPISYFSTGQEVPDDLLPANSDFLIKCILDGYKGAFSANSSR